MSPFKIIDNYRSKFYEMDPSKISRLTYKSYSSLTNKVVYLYSFEFQHFLHFMDIYSTFHHLQYVVLSSVLYKLIMKRCLEQLIFFLGELMENVIYYIIYILNYLLKCIINIYYNYIIYIIKYIIKYIFNFIYKIPFNLVRQGFLFSLINVVGATNTNIINNRNIYISHNSINILLCTLGNFMFILLGTIYDYNMGNINLYRIYPFTSRLLSYIYMGCIYFLYIMTGVFSSNGTWFLTNNTSIMPLLILTGLSTIATSSW